MTKIDKIRDRNKKIINKPKNLSKTNKANKQAKNKKQINTKK